MKRILSSCFFTMSSERDKTCRNADSMLRGCRGSRVHFERLREMCPKEVVFHWSFKNKWHFYRWRKEKR